MRNLLRGMPRKKWSVMVTHGEVFDRTERKFVVLAVVVRRQDIGGGDINQMLLDMGKRRDWGIIKRKRITLTGFLHLGDRCEGRGVENELFGIRVNRRGGMEVGVR